MIGTAGNYGQVNISTVGEWTNLGAAVAGSSLIISSLNICNLGTETATVNVSLVISGGTEGNVKQIFYVGDIDPNETVVIGNICMGHGDSLYVRSDKANISFNVFGIEQDL